MSPCSTERRAATELSTPPDARSASMWAKIRRAGRANSELRIKNAELICRRGAGRANSELRIKNAELAIRREERFVFLRCDGQYD